MKRCPFPMWLHRWFQVPRHSKDFESAGVSDSQRYLPSAGTVPYLVLTASNSLSWQHQQLRHVSVSR